MVQPADMALTLPRDLLPPAQVNENTVVRGDERRVVEAFCAWLESEGWTNLRREVGFVDVIAERDGETLYAEAKRRTAAIGLDVDTMYGQILRRMPLDDDPCHRLAVVVPDEALAAALRVPERVRRALRIEVYAVSAAGAVTTHA